MTASVIAAGALFAATGTEQQSLSLQPEQAPESVGTQAADDREQIKLPPIEKRPPAYPKLDSSLNRLAENAAAAASSTARSDSAGSRKSEPVLADFYVQGTRVDDLLHHLVEKDAYIRNIGEDYIEAHVPPSLLGEASEQPGVLRVDKVVLPRSKQSQDRAISQGVGLHGATAWHSAGYRGNNVKVGAIDDGFEGIQQMLNRKYPANALYYYCFYEAATPPANVLNGCTTNGNHGTAVTETLLDVAPRVQLYFSNPKTNGDLRRAVDWMASEGVTVINHSISKMVDGQGDGTSPYTKSQNQQGTSLTVTGLQNSRAYHAAVRAENSADESAYRVSAAADPYSAHSGDRPESVTLLTRSHKKLTARWQSGWQATSYHVTYTSDGGQSWSLAALNHPVGKGYTVIEIPDADNAKSYTVGVRGRNKHGDSGWRNSNSIGPLNIRLAVSNIAPTTATITLSNHDGDWHYKANATPDDSCSAAQSSATVNLTGLSSGTTYTYAAYQDTSCSNLMATAAAFTTGSVVTVGNLNKTTGAYAYQVGRVHEPHMKAMVRHSTHFTTGGNSDGYTLTVVVSDAGGLTDSIAVTVSLNDVAEAPTVSDATQFKNHAATVGSKFTLVLPAADANSGDGGPYEYLLWHRGHGKNFMDQAINGLSFDATTRTLSGTPTAAGVWQLSYVVHDNDTDRSVGDRFRARTNLQITVSE